MVRFSNALNTNTVLVGSSRSVMTNTIMSKSLHMVKIKLDILIILEYLMAAKEMS